MDYKNVSNKTPVGVIGAGSFGTAVANLLAENNPVILYSRRADRANEINKTKTSSGQSLHPRIIATNDIEYICKECFLIFPSVPSQGFREMLREFAPFLRPDHILIHTTKGLDVNLKTSDNILDKTISFEPSEIMTMSQVILQETNVKRIGCMSGPNLAKELAQHQPAATVIASHFDEVISEARNAIKSPRFQVYASHDIFGVELAGVLKNTMAIAAGILNGMGYGQNTMAFMLSRGVREMIVIGTALGADKSAFLGLAGIGDLFATASSPLSRNYTVGYRLAQGESLDYIISTSSEVAEGLKTVNICNHISHQLKLDTPIIKTAYSILFEEMELSEALSYLMNYKSSKDVDYV
ncbi:MAG: NAD(P)-dependent glycerol-3-phosphate dehydrogenase [Chitinophagales bacterium]|nr:NAD(P)-dependent glycerol-3-phosphate dehydrogenase [Chitinophagales bacterium]MCZ2393566.1 NAD(P)-dependent glycerol-3-phosphate dehydrogenase [Chitinophagales bacterium]